MFSEINLFRGTWQTIFLRIRQILKLDDLCMLGDFLVWKHRVEIDPQVLPYRAIEEYILVYTESNPFEFRRPKKTMKKKTVYKSIGKNGGKGHKGGAQGGGRGRIFKNLLS